MTKRCEKKKPRMSGGAAPALPKLAAARPRVAHERPGAARRGHLAPTDQPQPPARFRDAPIMHTCSSAHAQPGRTHMHNTLHTTFPHASTHDQQQHLGSSSSSSSSDGGDDSDSDSNSYRQFAMSFSGSIQQLHFSSTCRSVEFDSSACHQVQGRFVSIAWVSHGSFVRQSRRTRRSWQAATVSACVMCAMLCAVSVSLTLALQWLWVKHVSRGPTLSDQFLQQSCQTSEAQEPAAFIFLMHGVCCVLSVRTPEGVYKSPDISNTGLRGRRHTEPGLSGRRYYRIYRHQRYNRHHRYNRYLRYNRYPRYNRSDLLQPSETIHSIL